MQLSPSNITAILRVRYPDVYSDIISSAAPSFTIEDIQRIWSACELLSDRTMVYIGTCLALYSSLTLSDDLRVVSGLTSLIAQVKGVSKAAVSNRISEVIFWYSTYPEYRSQVNKIINQINNSVNGIRRY